MRETYLEQLLMVLFPGLGVHDHSLMDGIRDLLRVPRVDHDTSVQTLGGTGELRQDHHSLSLLLASNILVGDLVCHNKPLVRKRSSNSTYQVHTVPSAANQTNIADGVESTELIKRQTLVHKVDGHELDRSEPSIDPTNKFVNSRPQILVLLDVLP